MRLTNIVSGCAAALVLTLAAVPGTRAQDADAPAAEQPAETAPALPILEQLGVDARPAGELTADELQARIDMLTAALDRAELTDEAKAQLTAQIDADRQALAQMQAAAPAAEPAVEQPAEPVAEEQPAATEQAPAAAEAEAAPPAEEQPAAAPTVEEPAATGAETPPAAEPVQPAATEETPAQADAPASPEAPVSVEAPPQVSAAAEEKAAALLADKTPAESLADDALKSRVEQARALLDEPELSRKTAKALRKRLKTDRDALRARIAAAEAAEQAAAQQQAAAAAQQPVAEQPAAEPQPEVQAAPDQPAAAATTQGTDSAAKKSQQQALVAQPGTDAASDDSALEEIAPLLPLVLAPTIAEIPMLLLDSRPSDQLADDELNRRIQATRQAMTEEQDYSGDELTAFDRRLEQDREELNERLLANRSQRAAAYEEWDNPNLDINTEPEPGEPEAPNSIFAAEVDDEEMWDQITAAPLEPLPRRYSRHDVTEEPEEIMNLPEVREALPSIELDTITFGFNEAFVREEEIFDLDRIARMIERVVASRPDEIFMIEGHTDAVGSDAYNLKLSRQRAQAVKTALTRYYVIPPGNLATVGLGERYLKIWTPEAEEENRRVTVRRVTALVSGYEGSE